MWRGDEAWGGGEGNHLLVLAVEAVHGTDGNKVVHQVLHHPDVAPHGGVVEGLQQVGISLESRCMCHTEKERICNILLFEDHSLYNKNIIDVKDPSFSCFFKLYKTFFFNLK